MRHIIHDSSPPASLQKMQRQEPCPEDPTKAWNEFDDTELRANLWKLQYGRCAYCERTIELTPGGGCVDHVYPKGRDQTKTFEYKNLLLSCTNKNTCNLYKKGKWFENFIDPTQLRCETSFAYKRDGSIESSSPAVACDVKETVKLLNLEERGLKTARRAHFERLEKMIADMEDQLEAVKEFLQRELALECRLPFYSAKKQLFGMNP